MSVDPRLVGALRAQLERRPVDAARIGWKVGAGDGERIGREPVAVGFLTSASVLADGSTYTGGGEDLRADAELAVELDGGGSVYAYAVALELVDLADRGDAEAIVGSNIFHRAVAFSAFRRACPQPVRARVVVNGEERDAATAADDLVGRVGDVARVLAGVGERLEARDRVITGSIVQVPIESGDDVVAQIDGLGSVAVEVA